ncbi:PadR family transcriptional regulator [Actinoplanes sp. NPDC020271]|uniref:PadR family transcriptional regulator n=1 Tax=Actinoplanes sp. NPDC020271 TaxID=3363896 RepID=UPI0037B8DBA4
MSPPGEQAREELPAGWVRAVLDMGILSILAGGDRHGYALAQQLSGWGFGVIRGGSLYPVLNRLEAESLVSATWHAGEGGPGRKVYALTRSGRQRLGRDREQWERFAATVSRMMAEGAKETA